MLVQKISKPGEMISYILKLLDKFSSHMFRAKWQNTQLKSLVKNLPLKHCITVHDFSENFLVQRTDGDPVRLLSKTRSVNTCNINL